ncbi:hypothetical protein HOLleu_26687 [Holothuria leucospilota]|uniref:Retrotransposon gag domain-containing protein n=1 Tax=Holothuria leucospilota TaxID=206669 RepID=A0A9Q1H265_HOLLE|nr:hypothetical protein HOLleu_26687 [Holothuria leucospilota]
MASGLLGIDQFNPSDEKWDSYQERLEQHFIFNNVKLTRRKGERHKFYVRKQQSSENISEYRAALKKMARTCKFGEFLNEALRVTFVCGLKEELIEKNVLLRMRG